MRAEIARLQEDREASLQSQHEMGELNQRLTQEFHQLQNWLQQQEQAMRDQRESHTKLISQLQADRNRLTEHLALYMQQFANLNQSFGQLQFVVNELRSELKQSREVATSGAVPTEQNSTTALTTTAALPARKVQLKQQGKPLLQPQMGILLRPTPAIQRDSAVPLASISPSTPDFEEAEVVATTGFNVSDTPAADDDSSEAPLSDGVRGRTDSAKDPKLTHFVSDRLGQIETNRRFTTILMWFIAFLITALLLVGVGILVKSWEVLPPTM